MLTASISQLKNVFPSLANKAIANLKWKFPTFSLNFHGQHIVLPSLRLLTPFANDHKKGRGITTSRTICNRHPCLMRYQVG